jgi:outer membrane receptor protein involved in Fe transport
MKVIVNTDITSDWIIFAGRLCVLGLVLALLSPSVAALQNPAQSSTQILVVDRTESAVSGATVTVSDGNRILQQGVTDDTGAFPLNLRSGVAKSISVSAQGFSTVSRSIDSNSTETIRIVLDPASLQEHVIVSAERTATRIGETPASVSVLTSQQLATTPAVRLDDVLRQVVGFNLFRRSSSRTANPTTQGVSLRGTGASGASRALVLEDGIPINDPFGGWVYWGRVPRTSIQSVEVVRGGASGLYGDEALGGLININTRDSANRALLLDLSYGNETTPDGSLYLAGKRSGWSSALSAEFFHTDGYIQVAKEQRGAVDIPATSNQVATELTLGKSISQQLDLFLRGSLFNESRDNGTPLQTNSTHIRQLSVGLNWAHSASSDLTLRLYTGTLRFDQSFTAVSADRSGESLTRTQRVPAQATGGSIQWTQFFSGKHTLIAGLDAKQVRGASDELAFLQGRPASLVDAGGRERSYGLFVGDLFHVTERAVLTANLRYDDWRNYRGESLTRSIRTQAITSSAEFPDRSESAVSPRVGLLYRVSEKVSLFSSIYRSFRAPTLNELYRSFRVGDVFTLANEKLQAERLTGLDAGASFSAFRGRLSARAAFFTASIKNPVSNVTLSITPSLITRQRQNFGRIRATGAEGELNLQLNSRWRFDAGYQFVNSVFSDVSGAGSTSGLRVPQVPRNQFSFALRYLNPHGFTFAFEGRASSSQFDDDQNLFLLDPYFVLNGFVERRLNHRLSLYGAVENLFNQTYDVGRTPVRTVGPPIQLRIGMRLALGRP